MIQVCLLVQVNKETSTGGTSVRPKQRPPDPGPGGGHMVQQAFIRGNTVIRSKTFSPGPQSHYICRVTRTHARTHMSSTISVYFNHIDNYIVYFYMYISIYCLYFYIGVY